MLHHTLKFIENVTDFSDAPHLCWHQSERSRMSWKVLTPFSSSLVPAEGQDLQEEQPLRGPSFDTQLG